MLIRTNRSLRISLLMPLLICCLAVTPLALPVTVQAETAIAAEAVEVKKLEGRWLRPDGGYVLELKEIKPDGTLTAAYFNPMPIKVGKAELRHKEGKIAIFVELRDVNYPGSQYDLVYDQGSDRLVGSYFQAVLKQTFEVEFFRVK